MDAWVNTPRFFGITVRGLYWCGFHILTGSIVAYGALNYIKDPAIMAGAIVFALVSVALGLVEYFRIAPDTTAMITGFIIMTAIGSYVGFGRVDAIKEVVATVTSGAVDGYESVQKEAAGFTTANSSGHRGASLPSVSTSSRINQNQRQSSNKNWWNYAKDHGYQSTGKRMNQSQLDWAEARQNDEHNRVNFETKTIQKCVSCTRKARVDMGYFN